MFFVVHVVQFDLLNTFFSQNSTVWLLSKICYQIHKFHNNYSENNDIEGMCSFASRQNNANTMVPY